MRLGDISLKWKLLIAFLLLSFAGTTSLVVIAVHSQKVLIRHSEQETLQAHYQHFMESILNKQDQALGLATALATDPYVKRTFVQRDRQSLLDHLLPAYQALRQQYGVRQIHFHLPTAESFLRIHRPDQHGESMASYRRMIVQAYTSREGVGGLERGDTGYGIRGVVPIELEGSPTGTVEVGLSFGDPFVFAFKRQYHCDVTLFVPDPQEGSNIVPLASTLALPRTVVPSRLADFTDRHAPMIWMPLPTEGDVSGLLGPVRNFSGQVVALVEIRIDRTPVLSLLNRTKTTMGLVELIGLLMATLVVWLVAHRFLQPIREMVRGASEIVSGDRVYMPVRGRNELGQLARALNNMVGYLEASRQRMNDYAKNLEKEVRARTRELRKSEEKYRTLVDNVPLVVYQMTPERTLTFLNQYTKEMLGVEPSTLLEVPNALDRFIHSEDLDFVQESWRKAVSTGRDWAADYRLQTSPGRTIYVREQSVPLLDDQGRTILMDGIIVNATDQKKLQEKTLQAEELKTLGEVAARLAHEIRNPLTSIGGVSRRLMRELSESHPARPWGEVIVKEVERLESILQMILSFIQPVEIFLVACDLGNLMRTLLEGLTAEFQTKNRELAWTIAPDIPQVFMDPEQLKKALQNICRHTLYLMDAGGGLHINVTSEDDLIRIRWRYRSSSLSQDDLDHYFYPYLAKISLDSALLDLPRSKLILHKHGGLVQVVQGEENEIILNVTLPIIHEDKPSRPPDLR
jgi:PAS domain S-box-containing protein